MCQYKGFYYHKCKHICFQLFEFCHLHREQLDRINDPAERAKYAIPFDTQPECFPRCVFRNGNVVLVTEMEDGGNNIVQWVMVSDFCPKCMDLLAG